MAIDLLNIQPHQVSRDLRGYSVFFYGEPKSGKTTTASKFPDSLLLAFEKGYNALAGVMAQPINSWSEFRNASDLSMNSRISLLVKRSFSGSMSSISRFQTRSRNSSGHVLPIKMALPFSGMRRMKFFMRVQTDSEMV